MRVAASLAEAAARVGRTADRPLPWEPEPALLEAIPTGRVAAVDASRAVLVDNGAVWAVAVRAKAVTWPGPAGEADPIVRATTPEDAEDLLASEASMLGLPAPGRVHGADGLAAALMALHEAHAARHALAEAPDLLLLDGALHGLATEADALMAPVLAAAREAGIPVVGVAKRSGLSEGVPLVPAVAAALARRAFDGPWAVPVPGRDGVFVGRLHARAPHAYRVDVAAADVPGALGRLVPLARDAVYTGYPYPLAVAHNTVALGQGLAADLRERLRAAVLQAHGPAAARWLDDPHAMLDDNVR